MIAVRLVLVAVVAFGFIVLLTVHVTLPALTVVGLVAWAVLASIAALMGRNTHRRKTS